MTRYEILDAIYNLASSQGSYCRLYEELQHNDEYLLYLEKQNFTDIIDLIMFLEC